jgi:hypothetical protein
MSANVPAGTVARSAPSSAPEFADLGVPKSGIKATALREPRFGDIFSDQRGGAPTDIGGLRKLMNEPQTYQGAGRAITDKIVMQGKDDFMNGMSIPDIAKKYNVNAEAFAEQLRHVLVASSRHITLGGEFEPRK